MNHAEKELGYTPWEMRNFSGSRHTPRTILQLFRDARSVPRFSGNLTDWLAGNARKPGLLAYTCHRLQDRPVARGVKAPGPGSWGIDWIPDPEDGRLDPSAAFPEAEPPRGHRNLLPFTSLPPLREDQVEAWKAVPYGVQRLVVRLWVASVEAAKWVRVSLDGVDPGDLGPAELYALAVEPWVNEDGLVRAAAFRLMDDVDHARLAYASVLFLRHAGAALDEFRKWREKSPLPRVERDPLEIRTRLGRIRIAFSGDDRHEGGDGGAFVFLNTSEYGACGPAPFVKSWVEPNLRRSFAVGIDVHNPKDEEMFSSWGNYRGMPEREVSLHWDGREIVKRLAPAEFRGDWADCRITVRHVIGGGEVTVRLGPEKVYDRYFVPGLPPYESRLAIGAGTRRDVSTEFDVKNLEFERKKPDG